MLASPVHLLVDKTTLRAYCIYFLTCDAFRLFFSSFEGQERLPRSYMNLLWYLCRSKTEVVGQGERRLAEAKSPRFITRIRRYPGRVLVVGLVQALRLRMDDWDLL